MPERKRSVIRRWLGAALLLPTVAWAATAGLPPLGERLVLPNPYRGQTAVVDAGRQLFNTHCASCHGTNAVEPSAEAPDLRRLGSFCRRLQDAALRSHCLRDVDTYFVQSVHEGKVRAGVVHMPPWKHQLSQEEIWSIRTFIEGQKMDPPRNQTSVDRARQAGE